MKRSHLGVALSIAVHVVVGSVVVAAAVSHVATPALVPVAPPPPEIVEVELLPEPQMPATPPMPPAVPVRAIEQLVRPRTVVPMHHAEADPHDEPVASASPAHGLFAMRGRERTAEVTAHAPALPSVRTSADQLPEVAAAPMTPADQPPAQSPLTFAMRTASDGTAHLTDRRNGRFTTGRDLAIDGAVSGAEQWLDAHHEQSNAVDMKMPPVGPSIARFDMTDWAMRAAGQDPYAYEKRKALDATRDQRAQIGARHRELQLVQTPALVRQSLDEISALPAEQRAAALGQLWRDCDQSHAGELARTTITAYVRDHGVFTEADRAVVHER